MDIPLISVIIPVYNVSLYLKRCLDSVVNQTYHNLEIILVNDGSTDNSREICEEYAKRDKRIIVIHQDNKGLSEARNAGINIATGLYISFIDSDDYISKYFIEILLESAKSEKSDIVVCCFKKGNNEDYKFPIDEKPRIEKTLSAEEGLQQWHSNHKDVETVAWNKLYSAKLFKDGIRYPAGKYFEDVVTTHLLVQNANKITFILNELYYYFQRNTSIQGTWSEIKIYDKIYMQEKRLEWFRKYGYQEAYGRLLSKLMKYYMLCYVNADSNRTRFVLLEKFNKVRKQEQFKSIKDNFLFFFFSNFHKCIYNIYRIYRRK